MLFMNMKRWQMNLQFLGYYNGKIDGKKGAKTKSGTIKFKQDNNIKPVNDIVDQNTIDVMRKIICDIQKQLGVTVDGVAGQETIKAKEKQNDWSNIKHFKKSEFTCKCGCGSNNINLNLVKIADELREHFGKPCIVTSGTRCTKHNKKVGGVSNSRHLSGKAMDFYVQGISGKELVNYTQSLVNKGKLRYTYLIVNDAVHIDIV